MKQSIIYAVCILLFSTITFAQNTEKVLAEYQKRGLTFVIVKGLPNQKIAGLILQEVYGRLNIPVELVSLPGKRAIVQARNGDVDGESMRILKYQEKSPMLIRISPHIYVGQLCAFSKKHNFTIEGWDSLRPYKIGYLRGIIWAESGTEGMLTYPISNASEMMRMLDLERIDIALIARYSGLYELKRINLHNVIRPLSPPLLTLRGYHYLHNKHMLLVPIVEDLLSDMYANGELEKLRDKIAQKSLDNIKLESTTTREAGGLDFRP